MASEHSIEILQASSRYVGRKCITRQTELKVGDQVVVCHKQDEAFSWIALPTLEGRCPYCGNLVGLNEVFKPPLAPPQAVHQPGKSKPRSKPAFVPAQRRRGLSPARLALIVGLILVGCIGSIVGYRYLFARSTTVPMTTAYPTNTPPPIPTATPQPIATATTPRPTSTSRVPAPTSTQRTAVTASFAEQEAALLRTLRYRKENGKVIFADRAVSPPTLDGRLNEWSGLEYEISHEFHDKEGNMSGNWRGPSDLYGRFYAQWDVDNLYLGIEVTDDIHVQIEQGRLMFKGDEVEIQIDTNLESDFSDTNLSDDDGQIGLSAGDFDARNPEAYIWRLNGKERSESDIQVAAERTNNGYILEAVIPWWTLGGQPKLETAVGFTLCLSDNDVTNTAQQQTLLCTIPGRRWGDPTTWGTLILVDWK